MKFKRGDRVKMIDGGQYVHGEVTIVRTNDGMIRQIKDEEIICKVMFDEEWAPDYWYYPEKDLEFVEVDLEIKSDS